MKLGYSTCSKIYIEREWRILLSSENMLKNKAMWTLLLKRMQEPIKTRKCEEVLIFEWLARRRNSRLGLCWNCPKYMVNIGWVPILNEIRIASYHWGTQVFSEFNMVSRSWIQFLLTKIYSRPWLPNSLSWWLLLHLMYAKFKSIGTNLPSTRMGIRFKLVLNQKNQNTNAKY